MLFPLKLLELKLHDINKSSNPKSLPQHTFAAKKGGKIAGNARRQIEKITGKSVISPKNYLSQKQGKSIN